MAMLRDHSTVLTIDGVSAEMRRLFDALHRDYRFTLSRYSDASCSRICRR